jgi:uncharacterized integral membrane protein
MMELREYWDNLTVGGKIKFVLKVILGILAFLFALFNWQNTELHLVFIRLQMPLTILILAFGGIGFVLSSIFDYRRFKKKDEEIAALKKELEGLK